MQCRKLELNENKKWWGLLGCVSRTLASSAQHSAGKRQQIEHKFLQKLCEFTTERLLLYII